MKLQTIINAIALAGVLFIASCKEDPELPDNLVEFESDALGITEDESELTININLFREAEKDGEVNLQYEATGLTYGTDFTTEPAATGNTITLPVLQGATALSFTVKKVAGVLFDGDEELVLSITGVPASLVLGEKLNLTLSFDEIVALSGTMDPVNGGGATYPNKVFIDLSANRQTAVNRTTWDLGFSTGDNFRVILNSSNGALARMLDKNDLNAVTAADTTGFGKQLSIAAIFAAINLPAPPSWLAESMNWIDDPAGDITKTAIAAVSATASENKVYIYNRGTNPGTPATDRGWKKIRVVRNGNGYTVQHADISATSFAEISITKNNEFDFQYISLTTGAVDVEPKKGKWDIAWTGFTNLFPSGSNLVPYYFQDIVLQNMTGVQTVQVLEATKTYATFAESDIAGLDFSNQSQIKIGSSWRTGGGPGGGPTIRTDRYYIIKDSDNNYYKLKFTNLAKGGVRGNPILEFSLIKKGL
jgi:hypothetical protein